MKPTNPRKAAIIEKLARWKDYRTQPNSPRLYGELDYRKEATDLLAEIEPAIIRAYLTNPPEEAVEEVASAICWPRTFYWDLAEDLRKEQNEKARALLKRLAEKKGE